MKFHAPSIPERTVESSTHGSRSLQDWDCVESLDLNLLTAALTHVRHHGVVPDDMHSKEDQNSVGESGVSDATVADYATGVTEWLQRAVPPASTTRRDVNICVLDGFLLYPPPPTKGWEASESPFPDTQALQKRLRELMSATLSVKLFLPSTRELTLSRRAARSGYVTLEGFWEDPPGYVEEVVWPNYARDHAWMFADTKDVDLGRVDRMSEVVKEEGILIGPGSGEEGGGMEKVLEWGVARVKEAVANVLDEAK